MPRDFPNLIWPPVAQPSPRGRVANPQEIGYITQRATTVGFLSTCLAHPIQAAVQGRPATGTLGPWLVGLAAFVLMLVLGYLHYRSRGPAGA